MSKEEGGAPPGMTSVIDIYDTLGTMLVLGERARNDPAFQEASRDQAAIEHELREVPGAGAWTCTELDVDGTSLKFESLSRGDDWIAFHDLGDEFLYVHAHHIEGARLRLVALDDLTPYTRSASPRYPRGQSIHDDDRP